MYPRFSSGRSSRFKVSGSISDGLNERDATRRAPFWRRLRFMLIDCSVWVNVLVVVGTFGALCFHGARISDDRASSKYSTRTACHKLLARLLWPPVAVLVITDRLIVPLWYCAFPPSMRDRSELLSIDKTGVARPDVHGIAKASWRKQLGIEVVMDLIMLYTTALFVLTFVADFDTPACVLTCTR